MATWLVNAITNMFAGVSAWVVEAIGTLWAALPAIFTQALITAITDTLKDIVSGLIQGTLNKISEGIEAVQWIPQWMKNALNTFSGNLGSALDTIATGAIGMISEGSMEILGVTRAQEAYMNDLQDTLNVEMNALMDRITKEETATEETGTAITALLLKMLPEEGETFTDAARMFLGELVGHEEVEARVPGDLLENMMSYIQKYMTIDLQRIENLADEDINAAAKYATMIAVEHPKMVYDWFMETVAKPIAYGNNWHWAMNAPTDLDMETYKKQLKAMMITMNEVIAEAGAGVLVEE